MTVKLSDKQSILLDNLLQQHHQDIIDFYPGEGYDKIETKDLKYTNIFNCVYNQINLTHPTTKPQFVLDFLEKQGLYKPNN